MAQLLLVNPSVRPSRRKKKGVNKMKRRSRAQLAATKKLVALNRARRKSKKVTLGDSVMARKRRSKRTLKSVKRHGKPASRAAFRKSGYARNPIRLRRRVKRRSNPIAAKLGLGGIGKSVIPAAVGAGGAITLDLLWSYLPVPAMVKTGPMRHVAKAAGAIGLGIIAGMLVKKDTANALAAGALTVVMYNAAREAVATFAPNIPLGEYLAISDSTAPMLGEYLSGDGDELDGIIMDDDNYSMAGLFDSGNEF